VIAKKGKTEAQVIVAGIPASSEERLRNYVKKNPGEVYPGYRLRWFAAGGKQAGLAPARIDGLLAEAVRYSASAILLVSQRESRDTASVRKVVSDYFRCRTLSAGILEELYPTPAAAVATLNQALAEEELWAQLIRPSNVTHPLLLPHRVFISMAAYDDAWRAAAEASSDRQIRDVAVFVQNFGDAHRARRQTGKGRVYNSETGLQWDYRGARHGVAPTPRNWKFSFELPTGFHYDVMGFRGGAFELTDINKKILRVTSGGHANIDPHGWSR
jgi:hypothetical protein